MSSQGRRKRQSPLQSHSRAVAATALYVAFHRKGFFPAFFSHQKHFSYILRFQRFWDHALHHSLSSLSLDLLPSLFHSLFFYFSTHVLFFYFVYFLQSSLMPDFRLSHQTHIYPLSAEFSFVHLSNLYIYTFLL